MSFPQRLRFLLRLEDHARVVANNPIVVQDDAAQPEILRLAFRFNSSAPVPVMPLFEAELRYLPGMPGTVNFPQIANQVFAWTAAGYANLPVQGTLMITPHPTSVRAILENLDGLYGPPFPSPRAMWIWPVTLPIGFFQDFFNVPVARRHQVIKSGNRDIPKGHNDWPQFAAAEFLRGGATAWVEFAVDPLNDEAITLRMPQLVPDAGGNVEFRIAFATRRENEHDPKDSLDDLAAGRSKIDPTHPINGLVHAHWALRQLRDVPLGAAVGNPLADQIIRGNNPPGFDVIRFSTPGACETRLFHSGELARTDLTITRRLDGTLRRQLKLPTNGWLVLPREATPMGIIRANVNADFRNVFRYTLTNANRMGFTDGVRGFDFNDGTYDTSTAFGVAQPPAPARANDAERRAYSVKLAGPAFRWSRSPEIENAVSSELDSVGNNIKPLNWPGGQLFYGGTRDPKTDVTQRDIRTLFDAVQRVQFAGADPPQVRPGEAMCLWIMEGKLAAKRRLPPAPLKDAYVAGGSTAPFSADLLAPTPGAAPVGSVANIRAATEAQIRTMVRSFYMWSFFGLDIFAAVTVDAATRDTLLNWGTSVANGATINDARFRNALAGLTAAGFAAPTEAQVNATITITRSGGQHIIILNSRFVETMLWIQYSEFLRRIRELEVGPNAGAEAFPAFRYMRFNASEQAVTNLWARANQILAQPGLPPWLVNAEFALRFDRIPNSEKDTNPTTHLAFIKRGDDLVRSIAIRFGVIYRHYGSVFPYLLET
jgi:hypothetical protein